MTLRINKKIRNKIIQIFNNPRTGLEHNLKKLQDKNELLQKYSLNQIKAILNKFSSKFQRNAKSKKVKNFRSYHASNVGQLIHIDLMFLNSPRNTSQNIMIEDYRYLLIAVDTYSRFLMVYLLKIQQEVIY